ncbi:MAG: CinA family protein [Candidatus Omnitrophota bacterium]
MMTVKCIFRIAHSIQYSAKSIKFVNYNFSDKIEKMDKAEKVVNLLKQKKLTIAAAESCSGGYLSYLLTQTPGSSQVFKGGVIVYTLQAKTKLLKIPLSELKKTEGVSEKISLLLAKNIKKTLKSDIGVSIVGFAGPGAKKGVKVGTVYICATDKTNSITKKLLLTGNRDAVRKKASLALIDMLYKMIKKDEDGGRS